MNRRQFLHTSAVTLAAATYSRAAAREDRIRVAVMGVRGRGKALINAFKAIPGVEVAYVIDPDENVIPAALKLATGDTESKAEKDVRRVLDDKNVDVLGIAAPDHWHALATVWACQAGKHVYVEKPISHNVIEGQKMIEAARKYKRVVQYGAQRRSAEHFKNAAQFVKEGGIGKVPFARAWIAGNRNSIGHAKPEPVPAGVDFDLWLGPAPERPFIANRFHYDWHWFWDTGTGEIGNNGIHGLDLIRMLLPEGEPTRVSSHGGKYFYDDDREVPDTQIATFDFPDRTVVWEHRFWEKQGLEGSGFGVALHGKKGTLVCTGSGWEVRDGVMAGEKGGAGDRPHFTNFINAIREGEPLNADIEQGHKSTLLCHLGNIAYRLKKSLAFDPKTETFRDEKAANALLGRTYREPFAMPKEI